MEFEFANPLQYTSFNWNQSHISGTYIKFQPSTYELVHCTYFASLIIVCRIEVEPEPEATPFVEDPHTEPRQQGKQPPFDHVNKNPIPSLSHLCMNRMLTLCRFYRIVEPISFAWPIIFFKVVSKPQS